MPTKLSFKTDFEVLFNNTEIIAQVISSDFALCTDSEKTSWSVNSFYKPDDPDGRYMYIDYWMRQFHNLNRSDAVVQTASIDVGNFGGFGAELFGQGTWGTQRNVSASTRSYADRALRYYLIQWNVLP